MNLATAILYNDGVEQVFAALSIGVFYSKSQTKILVEFKVLLSNVMQMYKLWREKSSNFIVFQYKLHLPDVYTIAFPYYLKSGSRASHTNCQTKF